jgi:hypothetical protein
MTILRFFAGKSRLMICALALFCFSSIFYLTTSHTAKDFVGPEVANDANTVLYAYYARNLIRYDASTSKLLMVDKVEADGAQISSGIVADELEFPQSNQRLFYYTHPPGLMYLIALAFTLLGETIAAARVPSILLSFGTALALSGWVTQRAGLWQGAFCLCAFALSPLFLKHAVVANFEPATAFFMTVASIFFVEYLTRPAGWKIALALVAWAVGMLVDWPAYFLAPVFFLSCVFTRLWRTGLIVGVLPVTILAGTFGYMAFVTSDPNYPIRFATGAMAPLLDSVVLPHYRSWAEILYNVQAYAFSGFTKYGLLMAAAPALAFFLAGNRGDARHIIWLAFVLSATLNVFAFKQWAGEHNFWAYYLLPAVAVGASFVPELLMRLSKKTSYNQIGKVLVASTFVFIALKAGRTVERITEMAITAPKPADLALANNLKNAQLIISPDDGIYLGAGYLARWQLDKQLTVPGTIPEDCDAKRSWLALSETQFNRLPTDTRNLFVSASQYRWWVAPLSSFTTVQPVKCGELASSIL